MLTAPPANAHMMCAHNAVGRRLIKYSAQENFGTVVLRSTFFVRHGTENVEPERRTIQNGERISNDTL